MRTFLVLICSLALASLALSAEEGKGKKKEQPKKKAAHAGQVSQPAGKGAGKPTTAGGPSGAGKPSGVGKAKITGKPTGAGKPATVGNAGFEKAQRGQNKKPTTAGKPAGVGKPTGAGKPAVAGGAAATKVKPQHFNLANKPKFEVAPAVKFQQNRRIEGSQNWQGSNYTVFGITDRSGTIEIGGEAIPTASFSYSVDGMPGMRATGTRRGATIPTRIMHMTAPSTLTTTCRPIR